MTVRLDQVSQPARVADPDEGITFDELGLATRNHGLLLEALRYDVTPVGLHYLLTHFDIPAADAETWQIRVGGLVARPGTLSIADLRALPRVTRPVTLECAGNGRARLHPRPVSQPWGLEAVGTAEWTGTPLRGVLESVGVDPGATEVVFSGADHGIERGVEHDYQRSLPLAEALREEVLLVDEVNGAPLPPQHGAPVRLIVPGWYGMAHVKWLTAIELTDTPFTGYQQAVAYRFRDQADEPGEPVTRIRPRALLAPPGFPDYLSRTRLVRPGVVELTGRAWSGTGPVTQVELSTDGGEHWSVAELDPPGHAYAWQGWRAGWTATPGEHVLAVRATDAAGQVQPVSPAWNRGGFGNNQVQRVTVVCLPG